METGNVSKRLLMRLPLYLKYIKSLPDGTENVSATRIADALGLGQVMVRKDLAKVSDGGRRKLGYIRKDLIADMESFLQVYDETNVVVVGVGSLGMALLDYNGFEVSGLCVMAGFDILPSKKKSNKGKPILHMSELENFCTKNQVSIAIVTVPAAEAQKVCDQLVSYGVEAVWNFAPINLNVPDHVLLLREELALSLTTLRLQLKEREKKNNLGSSLY